MVICYKDTCNLDKPLMLFCFSFLNLNQYGSSGTSGTCPDPKPRNQTDDNHSVLCNNNTNICIDGVCTGTICVMRNITDCQCTTDEGNSESALCHVCCRQETSGTCQSSFDLFGSDGQFKVGGKACNNFEGYCSNDSPPRYVYVSVRVSEFERNHTVYHAAQRGKACLSVFNHK